MKQLYNKAKNDLWVPDDVCMTVTARFGTGGQYSDCHILYSPTVGALCARDYKGVGTQYVQDGKLVIEVRTDD